MISMNAQLMQKYMDHYNLKSNDVFSGFSYNAHRNALNTQHALFKREFTKEEISQSKMIHDPLLLLHCVPICDGAAAVLLQSEKAISKRPKKSSCFTPIEILASEAATDNIYFNQRPQALDLLAAKLSAEKSYKQAKMLAKDIDFLNFMMPLVLCPVFLWKP